MEQTKELFGLFLLLAFMLIFPGMVSLCDCHFAPVPKVIATSSVAVFSGQVQSVETKSVLLEDQAVVRTTYSVQPNQRGVFIGAQPNTYQLPRLHSADTCHDSQTSYLFVVIGPAYDSPYFWDCFRQPYQPATLLSR